MLMIDLSALQLHHFTKSQSSELRDALQGHDGEFGYALGGSN
jgi:hypothetical protein